MKIGKLFLRIVVGGFLIISIACGSFFRSEKNVSEDSPQPPLQYCELANHPEKYDGERVRLVTTLYRGTHGFKFMDNDCLGNEKETAVLVNEEVYAKLKNAGLDGFKSFPQILATGKFSKVTPSRKSDSNADNMALIFQMEDVERYSN